MKVAELHRENSIAAESVTMVSIPAWLAGSRPALCPATGLIAPTRVGQQAGIDVVAGVRSYSDIMSTPDDHPPGPAMIPGHGPVAGSVGTRTAAMPATSGSPAIPSNQVLGVARVVNQHGVGRSAPVARKQMFWLGAKSDDGIALDLKVWRRADMHGSSL